MVDSPVIFWLQWGHVSTYEMLFAAHKLERGAYYIKIMHTLHLVVLSGLPALAMPALARHNGGLAGDLLAAVRARLHIRDVVC